MTNFINLSNGIEAVGEYGLEDYRFMRIQSTWCEQKRWDDILMTLSDDFLMHAAQGVECVVYDYGARKPVPRAIYQGLEFVKYVLLKRWEGVEYKPVGRCKSARSYFGEEYLKLQERTKTRLDYFGKYKRGNIRISAITAPTKRDGSAWYIENIRLET